MERGEVLKNKKAQVTIFVIIGILLIVAIILYFIFSNDINISTRLNSNPASFIEKCAQEGINPLVENVIMHGGVYYSGFNDNQFKINNGTEMAILCKTNASGSSCINQHPLLPEEIKYDLEKVVRTKLNECFLKLKKNYPSSSISEGDLKVGIDLVDGNVIISIDKPLTITSGEESNSFENFDLTLNSNINNFVELANVIVNTESSCDCNKRSLFGNSSNGSLVIYMPANGTVNPFLSVKPNANCDVDLAQMNKLYPNFVFTRTTFNNGEKIYTITSTTPPIQNFSFVVINCISGCGGPDGVCYHHYHDGDGVIHYSSHINGCHNNIHHYHDSEEYIIDP